MGKDDKEDTGFGFKDKAKAEETLRLLEQHEPNYRRLTVRGLLGRAKRTLSLTKAEEKKKNIKEAIAVFENWIAELDKNKDKNDKKESKTENKEKARDKDDDDKESTPDVEMKDVSKMPSDKVPNLGFKDPAAAETTLRELEGRDPEYQRLAVKGLIGSANRVLTCTRDETKLSNIKEAITIFEKFLDEYDTKHMSRQNNAYLSLGVVNAAVEIAGDVSKQQKAFIAAYASVNGEYKRLRTVAEKEGGKTWDIVRNTALKELKEKYAEAKLFYEDKKPTNEHLEMILWAYSPEPAQVKKIIPEKQEKQADEKNDRSSRKRKSSANDNESPEKKQKD